MSNEQKIRKIIERKIDQLLKATPEFGSIAFEAVFHSGNLVRVILKSEESEIVTSENK